MSSMAEPTERDQERARQIVRAIGPSLAVECAAQALADERARNVAMLRAWADEKSDQRGHYGAALFWAADALEADS